MTAPVLVLVWTDVTVPAVGSPCASKTNPVPIIRSCMPFSMRKTIDVELLLEMVDCPKSMSSPIVGM
jgi:hypothetical protein